MQTFVPYANIDKSAQALDNKRLNKQLLEGRQIYKIIASGQISGAWVNHPAVKMWRNHDNGLFAYLTGILKECNIRGIATEKNWNALCEMHESNWNRGSKITLPPWWGDKRVHQSHRNNLYRKDPEYYAEFYQDGFISCCEKCNYFWPVSKHAKEYTSDPNWSYV
jgi:hypothetical protein